MSLSKHSSIRRSRNRNHYRSKLMAKRILEDIPRPSNASVMEVFYGGDGRKAVRELPTEFIDPNPTQPRQLFDVEQLAELTDSIRELGLIQPIVVRPID